MLKNEVIIVMKCREPLKLEYENHSSDHGNGYSDFEWAMWAEQVLHIKSCLGHKTVMWVSPKELSCLRLEFDNCK